MARLRIVPNQPNKPVVIGIKEGIYIRRYHFWRKVAIIMSLACVALAIKDFLL